MNRLSEGKKRHEFNIVRKGENNWFIHIEDWFHTFTSLPTSVVIVSILIFYFLSIILWASLFYMFRSYGFIDIHSAWSAMFISLETITTVGYTVTDITFNKQPVAFVLLFCEMMQAILMNSFCIGVVYARFSRALSRTCSIMFSDNATIRQVNGVWYFLLQVCELRKHQLVDCHISCYCIQKSVSSTSGVPFQLSRMRLLRPNDESGGVLLLMLPAVVIHRIDCFSPLYPNSVRSLNPSNVQINESMLRKHIESLDLEIMSFVEGTESVTGSQLQAFWSYCVNDIQFNKMFTPCVSIGPQKKAVIDFGKFNDLIDISTSHNENEDLFVQSIL